MSCSYRLEKLRQLDISHNLGQHNCYIHSHFNIKFFIVYDPHLKSPIVNFVQKMLFR